MEPDKDYLTEYRKARKSDIREFGEWAIVCIAACAFMSGLMYAAFVYSR